MAAGCDRTADARHGALHRPAPTLRLAVPVATVLQMTRAVRPPRAALVATVAALLVCSAPATAAVSGLSFAAGGHGAAPDRRRRPGGPRPSARRHGAGPVSPGTVGEFPGADVPFGMMQWSPDTSPNAVQAGRRLRLRRLRDQRLQPDPPERNGVPVVSGRPDTAHRRRRHLTRHDGRGFSHQQEHAAPGSYQVSWQAGRRSPSRSPSPPARASRASTSRPEPSPTCSSRWRAASTRSTAASVHVVGHDEVEGQVSSGQFCGTGTELHVALRGALRPAVLVCWDVDERGHGRGNCRLHRDARAAPTSRSTRPKSDRCS